MTIREALDTLDRQVDNTIPLADKLVWLNRVEQELAVTLLGLYDIPGYRGFTPFQDGTDPDTRLQAPEPFCELYRRYLELQVYSVLQEPARYNAAAVRYNAVLQAYHDYITRTYRRKDPSRLKLY